MRSPTKTGLRLPWGRPWGQPLTGRHTNNPRSCQQLLPRWSPGQLRMASSSKWSYDEGSTETPLLPHTIPEHFATIVSKYGDKPAVSARKPYSYSPSASSSAFSPPPIETLTYSSLDSLSSRLALGLREAAGVRKGDRVAVSLGNCVEFAALTYAVFKLGAVLVPLNPAFTAQQVKAALNHLEARVLVMGAVADLAYKPGRGKSNWDVLGGLVPELGSLGEGGGGGGGGGGGSNGGGSTREIPKELHSPLVPSLKRIILVDNASSHPSVPFPSPLAYSTYLTPYSSLLRELSSPFDALRPRAPPALSPDETINIQFTSGTTSLFPKAAQLTHRGILNNGHLIGTRMGLRPGDRIVVPPPLFHCFGSVLGYMATATHGAEIVFPSPAFDPRATLTTIREVRADGCYGVGTMMVALLELLDEAKEQAAASAAVAAAGGPYSSSSPPADLEAALWADHPFPAHLTKGIVAGSLVPEALMKALLSKLGFADLVICYGMTETSPVTVMTSPRDPMDKRTGTVGRAMDHTAVRVVDPDDRARVLRRGEPGELAAAGYCVMRGYYGDRKQTDDAFLVEETGGADGPGRTWMHTGDEAIMEDGPAGPYIRITGRIKDLIIRGGENIHPMEIENCLFQHPNIMEASVVGTKDEKLGEAVVAFVVPHHAVVVDGPGGGKFLSDQEGEEEGSTAAAVATTGVGAGAGAGTSGKEEEAGNAPHLGNDVVLTKDDVRNWVRTRLSGHLVPKYVFWVRDYPKTASGKIQKFKLREMADKIVHGRPDGSSRK